MTVTMYSLYLVLPTWSPVHLPQMYMS